MPNKEYDLVKEYEISGVKVRSEIVKDDILGDTSQRALVIRSSCDSRRWGTRTQDHSYTCPTNWPEFQQSFEQIRLQAAETLAKTELGQIPETTFRFLAAEVHGPTGKKITAAAVADLSLPPTLLGSEMIEILQLQPSGEHYYQKLPTGISQVQLFKARIKFGPYDVETSVAPSQHGSPA